MLSPSIGASLFFLLIDILSFLLYLLLLGYSLIARLLRSRRTG